MGEMGKWGKWGKWGKGKNSFVLGSTTNSFLLSLLQYFLFLPFPLPVTRYPFPPFPPFFPFFPFPPFPPFLSDCFPVRVYRYDEP